MAGLPKIYARMGFAKGWRAYKASKRTKSHPKQKINTRMVHMAKRRFMKAKRRSSSAGMGGLGKLALGGAIYGLAREPINSLAKNLPFVGSLGDEIALGLISAVMATKGSGWIKTIGRAGVVVEAHNLARSMGGNILGSFMGTSASAVSTSTQNSFR